MLRNIEKLSADEYGLLVIGGGINGAGIANIAARHGVKVCLLEKNDFASGTSGRSTKLIHGGLRYLENFEFGLVRESLKERYIQLKAAPHLVKPLRFVIPVYKKDKRPLWLMHLGVSLYDCLAGKYVIQPHSKLSAQDILREEPLLKKEGLLGGLSYFDAQMDDERLCLENVLCAKQNGADAQNYTQVISFIKENGKVKGVEAVNKLSGEIIKARARQVVCAVGPWSNILLKVDDPQAKDMIRLTKGAHIVYSKQLSHSALLIPSDRDSRVFFVIPWQGHSLIGTTDTDYSASPDEVKPDSTDIDYLVEVAKRVFPQEEFSKENIITAFAGLRPLLYKKGVPSAISRRHAIFKTASGIIFVLGGKYTTYRKIAYDCLCRFMKINPREEFRLAK